MSQGRIFYKRDILRLDMEIIAGQDQVLVFDDLLDDFESDLN